MDDIASNGVMIVATGVCRVEAAIYERRVLGVFSPRWTSLRSSSYDGGGNISALKQRDEPANDVGGSDDKNASSSSLGGGNANSWFLFFRRERRLFGGSSTTTRREEFPVKGTCRQYFQFQRDMLALVNRVRKSAFCSTTMKKKMMKMKGTPMCDLR